MSKPSRARAIDAEERKAALLAASGMVGVTTFKMRCDPRIARMGRLTREASVGELPQLWSVYLPRRP